MTIRYSARNYAEGKHQVVIVGLNTTEKNMIMAYIESIIDWGKPEEPTTKKKDWEEPG